MRSLALTALVDCGNYLSGSSDQAYFYVIPGNGWEGAQTFSIVTDQATPCVRFTFENPILSKTPHVENYCETEGCLAVDMPTPIQPATWGSVKSLYR